MKSWRKALVCLCLTLAVLAAGAADAQAVKLSAKFNSAYGWVQPGEAYPFFVQYEAGAGGASSVVVRVTIPSTTVYVSATPAPSSGNGSSTSPLTWSLGTLAPNAKGQILVPQIGNVVIEDDVEIGANCAIDRATLGSTILRKGVKFDNLVHIAHNVEIGERSYLAAANVVAGSTKIGKGCMFSGQVGIVGHLNIADNTIITAQSGISKNITKAGEVYMGSPAFDANKYRKAFIHFRNLDSIAQRLSAVEKAAKEPANG